MNTHSGMSLFEVLAAVFLILIMLLSLNAMEMFGRYQNHKSYQQSVLDQEMQNQYERNVNSS